MNIAKLHQLFLNSNGVSIDSRKIEKNQLFFSISGKNFDGSSFAQEAIEKGAKAAIVPSSYPKKDERYIHCENGLETLQALAGYHRSLLAIPLIAITGSNGKTTTKDLITAVLKTSYSVTATKGNYNNAIGTMLSLLSISKNTDIAVIEIGANHIGEIADLCNIIQPTTGLVTTIGKAHLEGFGNYQGVIKAKKELYDYLLVKDKTAFFNSKDREVCKMSKFFNSKKKYHYGEKGDYFYASVVEAHPYISYRDEKNTFIKTNIIGTYNFVNIVAALAVGKFFSVSLKKAHKAIADYVPKNNRSQVIKTSYNRLYLDAYNANPTSMEMAIASFVEQQYPIPIVILGDMFELGNFSQEEHKKMIEIVENYGLEAFFCGELFFACKRVIPQTHFFPNRKQLQAYLKDNPIKKADILLKGSRRMQLEELVEVL